MADLVETAVNWDHEKGEIVVSTRRRGIASKLKKLGLQPVLNEGPYGYTTFIFSEKQVKLSFRGAKKRPASAAAREAGKRLAARGKAKKAGKTLGSGGAQ